MLERIYFNLHNGQKCVLINDFKDHLVHWVSGHCSSDTVIIRIPHEPGVTLRSFEGKRSYEGQWETGLASDEDIVVEHRPGTIVGPKQATSKLGPREETASTPTTSWTGLPEREEIL